MSRINSGDVLSITETPPKISIITAVYNGMPTVARTIQSVLDQGYSSIEYIVIDGGSTDGTLDVVKGFENDLAYWVSETDAGIADAFNKGVARATGGLIALLNADDWYEPGVLARVISLHEKNPDAVIHGDMRLVGVCQDLGGYIRRANPSKTWFAMTLNHPAMFVPKHVYDTVGLFDKSFRYAMDYDWVRRAEALGVEFVYVPEVFTNVSLQGVSDERWWPAYREVARVRRAHGLNPMLNSLLLGYMGVRTLFRRGLERVRLMRVIRRMRGETG